MGDSRKRKKSRGHQWQQEETVDAKLADSIPHHVCYGVPTSSPFFEVVSFLLAVVVTSNSLHNPFVLDDLTKIRDNPDIRSLSGIHKTIFYPYIDGTLQRNDPSRPLTFLTYAMNHALIGTDPWGFRLVNIVMHWLNCLGIRHLMRRIEATWRPEAPLSGVPEAASLLFLSTPVNVGTATYVFARSDILCTLLTLLYLQYSLIQPPTALSSASTVLLHFAALASKQTALILPLLSLCLSFAISSPASRPHLTFLLLLHSPPTAVYLLLRLSFLGGLGDLEASQGHTHAALPYLLSQPYAVLRYTQMLLFPARLAIDHAINPPDTFHVSAAAAVVVGLVAASCTCRRVCGLLASPPSPSSPSAKPSSQGGVTSQGKAGVKMAASLAPSPPMAATSANLSPRLKPAPSCRLFPLALCWYLVCLCPSSSVVPTVDCLVERRVYLASAGAFALADASLLHLVGPKWRAAVLAATISAFAVKARHRNAVFGTEEGAWGEALEVYPESTRALNNLATLLMDQQDPSLLVTAASLLHKVLRCDPADGVALNNLGAVYDMPHAGPLYRPDEAVSLFRQAVAASPSLASAHYNLGLNRHRVAQSLLIVRGREDAPSGEEERRMREAERSYRKAVSLQRSYTVARSNLGVLLLHAGRVDEARAEYETALAFDPESALVKGNLERLEAIVEEMGGRGVD